MKKLLNGFLFVILLTACSKNSVNPCDYNACALKATAAEITTVENYLAANSIVATKHCSGLYYVIDVPGSGTSPTICSQVSVKYKGQFSNGAIFDQATTPVSFSLNMLIESWKKGMLMLKTGGKIKLWVPPSLAYGSQDVKNSIGVVVIPANSMLIFEVELVAVL